MNDVASVFTVLRVPNLLFCDSLFRLLRGSNRLDIAEVSVIWLDASDCRIGEGGASESAKEPRTESPTDTRVESAREVRSLVVDARGRRGERGGGLGNGGTTSLSPSLVPFVLSKLPAVLLPSESDSLGLSERTVGSVGCVGLMRFRCTPDTETDVGDADRCADDRFGVDAVARESVPCPYGPFRASVPWPWIILDLSAGGNSDTRSNAMMFLATRAIESGVLSIRSSRWNSSSGGTPSEEQAARNFVTFDVRTKPSSRLSTRGMSPGCSLLTSL